MPRSVIIKTEKRLGPRQKWGGPHGKVLTLVLRLEKVLPCGEDGSPFLLLTGYYHYFPALTGSPMLSPGLIQAGNGLCSTDQSPSLQCIHKQGPLYPLTTLITDDLSTMGGSVLSLKSGWLDLHESSLPS